MKAWPSDIRLTLSGASFMLKVFPSAFILQFYSEPSGVARV
jgi:hypothetical protein